MASSSCSSRSSRTTVRLVDCPSAIYWSAILHRSRSSITGFLAIRLSFGRAGAMAKPGLQDPGGTADGHRAVTAAEGAYPTQLGRGRVGALGHVLQRGTQMEDGCGPDLGNPRLRYPQDCANLAHGEFLKVV